MGEEPRSRCRPVVLCADDYGMNEGVSRGILTLAGEGRISATSCMTNAPHWPQAGRALASAGARIGIGLHLTLTWGRPLGSMPGFAGGGTMPSLARVLRGAAIPGRGGARTEEEIRREVERQLDAFVAVMGRPPDFVDGHQHVHVLPGIRSALFEVLSRRGLAGRLWLRDPSDRLSAILGRRLCAPKALFVSGLATGFRRDAGRAGFGTNRGFSGFSPFDPRRDPAAEMSASLTALGPRPLVMCHPGLADPGPDEIAGARLREFDYLRSPAFLRDLSGRGLELAPAPA